MFLYPFHQSPVRKKTFNFIRNNQKEIHLSISSRRNKKPIRTGIFTAGASPPTPINHIRDTCARGNAYNRLAGSYPRARRDRVKTQFKYIRARVLPQFAQRETDAETVKVAREYI